MLADCSNTVSGPQFHLDLLVFGQKVNAKNTLSLFGRCKTSAKKQQQMNKVQKQRRKKISLMYGPCTFYFVAKESLVEN